MLWEWDVTDDESTLLHLNENDVILTFWQFHDWLHQKLSFWHLMMHPAVKTVKMKTFPFQCSGTLETKRNHDANFFLLTGGNGGCYYDNLTCYQWRQSWRHETINFQCNILVLSGTKPLPELMLREPMLSKMPYNISRPSGVKESPLWHHNRCDGVSNQGRLDCLLNRLFGRRSKKTSKLCVTVLCEGNPPVTGGFPSQRASNTENVSIQQQHHDPFYHTSIATNRLGFFSPPE